MLLQRGEKLSGCIHKVNNKKRMTNFPGYDRLQVVCICKFFLHVFVYECVCWRVCVNVCSCTSQFLNISIPPLPLSVPHLSSFLSHPSLLLPIVPPVLILISGWKLPQYRLCSKVCPFLPLFFVPSPSDRILSLIAFTLPTCLCSIHPPPSLALS